MKFPFVFLFFMAAAFATNDEDYFGTFATKERGCVIRFIHDENGIHHLIVDDLEYDTASLDYTVPSYGSGDDLRIKFIDDSGYTNIIKAFIYVDQQKFIISTGFYLRFKVDDKENMIFKKKRMIQLLRIKSCY
jgi:hypothetical protein